MKNEGKRIVKKNVWVALSLILLTAFIGGTYARYVSSATGSGSVEIAKWAVKVNNTDISSSSASGTFNLSFSTNTNADIVAGKLAPGGTATAYVDVDLTGTEVSVDFSCGLSTGVDLTSVFGEGYADRVQLSVGTPALEGATSNMTLDTAHGVVKVGTAAMRGKVRVPITLAWANKDGSNAADTSIGATKTAVTIPVTLSVKQHISTDTQ